VESFESGNETWVSIKYGEFFNCFELLGMSAKISKSDCLYAAYSWAPLDGFS